MANILKNFLDYLKLGDDDDYEDYVDDYDQREDRIRTEKAQRDRSREHDRQKDTEEDERKTIKKRPKQTDGESSQSLETRRDKVSQKTERTTSNKIVPIRTTPKGLEVCIMKPASFEDSQDICDMLLTGRAVVVNLEGFDPNDAQRIMDFISGAVYAINGKLHQISRYIFIFSPDTIDISGDYQDLVPVEGFGIPHLNKEF